MASKGRVRKDVIAKFEEIFGEKPECIVRCPGRVNLIGEHIDYNGYGVLPIAVQQSIYAGLQRHEEEGPAEIRVHNLDDKFPSFKCPLEEFEIRDQQPGWQDYFLCGVRAGLDLLRKTQTGQPRGYSALVGSSLPIAAGLSSSSALVCCSALCTIYAALGANWEQVSRSEIAEQCAIAERYVGVHGGGMDQSICMLAEKNTAMLIEFSPLRLNRVSIPSCVTFLVCNSMVKYEKGDSSSQYNVRVTECRLAAMVLAKKLGLPWESVRTLRDVQEKGRKELREMPSLVDSHLHEQPYEVKEIEDILGCPVASEILTPSADGLYNLHNRALHVYEESLRVHEFRRLCDGACRRKSVSSFDVCNVRLGELMNESHTSCAVMYECSCSEVNTLQEILTNCFKGTVFGARMTGAGWGGCLVALVERDGAEATVEAIRLSLLRMINTDEQPVPHVFLCQSSSGAEVELLSYE